MAETPNPLLPFSFNGVLKDFQRAPLNEMDSHTVLICENEDGEAAISDSDDQGPILLCQDHWQRIGTLMGWPDSPGLFDLHEKLVEIGLTARLIISKDDRIYESLDENDRQLVDFFRKQISATARQLDELVTALDSFLDSKAE